MSLPSFADLLAGTGFDATAPYGRDAEGRAYTAGPDVTGKGGGDYPNPNIRTAVPTMSVPVSNSPATGAQTSIMGGFTSLVENIAPGVLGFLTAKENAKAAAATGSAATTTKAGQTGDWRDTVATPAAATKSPTWLIPAIIGGAVLLVAVLFFAVRGRR